jgi:2-polyprenyl-3-methyl-5-hydroxy-6-metoxy-1,4-benzoquinol methylase
VLPGEHTETTDCPVCRVAATFLLSAADTNRRTTSEIFDYLRCGRCGLVFMKKVPGDLSRYYPDDYHPASSNLDQFKLAAEREEFKLEIVRSYATEGALLEVGGSWGSFAYIAARSGFDVTVIEMNEPCCQFIRESLGIKAILSDDVGASLPAGARYRVIVLWHVIEHLPNPWKTLDALTAAVEVGGTLVVATPNPDAMQFRLFRGRWTHVDAPRHTTLIPWRLLVQELARRGMIPRLVTMTDEGSLGYDSFGWAMSLSHMSSRPVLQWILRKLGRVISVMIRPIERRRRRGSCYTAVFERVAS